MGFVCPATALEHARDTRRRTKLWSTMCALSGHRTSTSLFLNFTTQSSANLTSTKPSLNVFTTLPSISSSVTHTESPFFASETLPSHSTRYVFASSSHPTMTICSDFFLSPLFNTLSARTSTAVPTG